MTFLHLRHYQEKICGPTCFSKDAEGLITYGCLLWRGQIVYIRPYSLNTTTVFYFVTECSSIAVFVRLRVCMSQCIGTLLGLTRLGISVPLCRSVVPSEQIVLRMCLYTWGSASNAVPKPSVKVSFCSPVTCKISDLLFFVGYFVSQSKGIKFGDYFLMCVV